MLTTGVVTSPIGHTQGVPLPKPQTYRPVQRRNTSPFAKQDATRPAQPDPDAIARLQRLGVVTVSEEVIDQRPVKVVAKTKPRKKPSRPRTNGAGYAKPTFDVDEATRLYQTGMSTRAVGQQLGVTGQTIIAHLRRAGVERREHSTPKADHDLIVQLAGEGLTLTQIANRAGVALPTAAKHLARAGVTARDGRRDPTPITRTDLDLDAIRAEYAAGATIPKLARTHGAATATIRRNLIAAGVTLRDDRKTSSGGQNRIPDDVAARIVAAYATARSASDVARDLDMPASTVNHVLHREGIPVRPAGVAQRGRPGLDGAAGLKALMRANDVTTADVRAWARDTGRPIPPRGLPTRRLLEDYLLDQRAAPN